MLKALYNQVFAVVELHMHLRQMLETTCEIFQVPNVRDIRSYESKDPTWETVSGFKVNSTTTLIVLLVISPA